MRNKGFTLIELLVVLAIMGILMGILFIAYDGVRKSARDGKRKADLEQIRSALEMCRSDTGSYPSALGGSISCGIPAQTYMANVPTDPLSSYSYTYNPVTPDSDVTYISYTLCAHLETGAATSNCSGFCTVPCGGADATCDYKTCNP